MDALINSFLIVFFSEMGDKTQLLALLLVAKYGRPWTILAGVFFATLLNHAFASWLGGWAATFFEPEILRWAVAGIFFAFGLWLLIPDKSEDIKQSSKYGPFLTTLVVFFLAEMGDKTQLATVALGAKYSSVLIVTVGSTLGMMASNALAVFLGEKVLSYIPMKWIRVIACILFMVFGAAVLVGY